ncbi:lamin-L(III)-like isoform X2 [Rhinatrema bivittatum]|uniref:lamin-L(III)-like isoform X2 n=1 Tax=Rhinatrema bivittatum TaxID=194408 RepID=UPI001126CE8E|nr:lamin-L(III)-like isoform X2 [Rhinatrema bivittatum]
MASATSTPTSICRPGSSRVHSPVSPAKLSRQQEKDELRQLNDRLAAYIERVRALEADKSVLKLELEEREDVRAREVGSLRLLYETELADARKLLDITANERARLQVELGKTRDEYRQLQTRNCKKETELNLALGHLRDLEAQLYAKEAELATVVCNKRDLECQLQESKTQIACLESSICDATKQLHDEMLCRVDLENKAQTFREQMEFQKCIYEEEIKETKRRHETRITEIDSGRQVEFEFKLAEALRELRREHEDQIQDYKEELERTFCTKLATAQMAAAKNCDYANAMREEMACTKMRMEALTSQLTQYQKQEENWFSLADEEARAIFDCEWNSAFENTLRELHETLDREREMSRNRACERDLEMAEVRQKLQCQLEEYEQLLDVKLALDMEINAYRKMLEGEEDRLKLSSTPCSPATISRVTISHGRQLLRGKKRKIEETEREEAKSGFKIIQRASSLGVLAIDEIDPDGKFVKLKNNSDTDQPLHGWELRRRLGSLSEITYKFPTRFILKAGQTVTIWGAGASLSKCSPSDLVWKTQRSWGVGHTVEVLLFDPSGEEAAERRIEQVKRGCDYEEELDEEITGCRTECPPQTKRRKKKCCSLS